MTDFNSPPACYRTEQHGVPCPQYSLEMVLKKHSDNFSDVFVYFQKVLYPRYKDLVARDKTPKNQNESPVDNRWYDDVESFIKDAKKFITVITGKDKPPYFSLRREKRLYHALMRALDNNYRAVQRSEIDADIAALTISNKNKSVLLTRRILLYIGVINSHCVMNKIHARTYLKGRKFNDR